ncbi:MAG: hypothetical protein Q7S84_02100 [bacterium]|nr:hypothetical protein [bacterium]
MNIFKVAKDRVGKFILGTSTVPSGLLDLHRYFKNFGPIRFEHHREGDTLVSVSANFTYGSIVAHGRTPEELDRSVKDGILTAFSVPSAYAPEAAIRRETDRGEAYAAA